MKAPGLPARKEAVQQRDDSTRAAAASMARVETGNHTERQTSVVEIQVQGQSESKPPQKARPGAAFKEKWSRGIRAYQARPPIPGRVGSAAAGLRRGAAAEYIAFLRFAGAKGTGQGITRLFRCKLIIKRSGWNRAEAAANRRERRRERSGLTNNFQGINIVKLITYLKILTEVMKIDGEDWMGYIRELDLVFSRMLGRFRVRSAI